MSHTVAMGRRSAAAVAAGLLIALAGCSADPSTQIQVAAEPQVTPTTVRFDVAQKPGERTTAVVRDARIVDAELVSEDQDLPVKIGSHRVRTTAGAPGQRYRLTVQTNGEDGLRSWTKRWRVRPATDEESVDAWLTPEGALNGNGDVRMHEVYVCGLTPAKTYYYRVGGEGH